MTEFEKVLIERDGLDHSEAVAIRKECIRRVAEGEDPNDVLADWGLELDYVEDILDYRSYLRLF